VNELLTAQWQNWDRLVRMRSSSRPAAQVGLFVHALVIMIYSGKRITPSAEFVLVKILMTRSWEKKSL
jgi:hypothetical protein